MDAKEFRTGNLLNYTTAEGDILTSALDWQDFKWLEEDKKGFELVHDYIRINKQWLLDFGFQYFKYNCSDAYKLIVGDDFIEFVYCEEYLNGVGLRTNGNLEELELGIHHVHQLQNLYYSLTGQELIKK